MLTKAPNLLEMDMLTLLYLGNKIDSLPLPPSASKEKYACTSITQWRVQDIYQNLFIKWGR